MHSVVAIFERPTINLVGQNYRCYNFSNHKTTFAWYESGSDYRIAYIKLYKTTFEEIVERCKLDCIYSVLLDDGNDNPWIFDDRYKSMIDEHFALIRKSLLRLGHYEPGEIVFLRRSPDIRYIPEGLSIGFFTNQPDRCFKVDSGCGGEESQFCS